LKQYYTTLIADELITALTGRRHIMIYVPKNAVKTYCQGEPLNNKKTEDTSMSTLRIKEYFMEKSVADATAISIDYNPQIPLYGS
jgi:hypothetical protein